MQSEELRTPFLHRSLRFVVLNTSYKFYFVLRPCFVSGLFVEIVYLLYLYLENSLFPQPHMLTKLSFVSVPLCSCIHIVENSGYLHIFASKVFIHHYTMLREQSSFWYQHSKLLPNIFWHGHLSLWKQSFLRVPHS